LLPGTYHLEADAPGFDHLVHSGVVLQIGQTLSIDLTLSVGAKTDAITVTEAAPLADSQSSHIAQVVNRAMLDGLPLPNRAASSLAALAPGVVMIDTGSGTAEN